MNVSQMKKVELIAELKKRLLPTNGLKEDLITRLMEDIENKKSVIKEIDVNKDENVEETVNVDESNNNDDTDFDDLKCDKDEVTIIEADNFKDVLDETLNEDIIIDGDQSTILTIEDAIKMKTPHEIESDSMIVNINEDDVENDSISNSPYDDNVNSIQTFNNNNREMDNGDHEIIEISEEVVIDDEDNQENDNNYNDISSDSNQLQSRDVENEMEKIESRLEGESQIPVKTEIWVSNIAEDVKAVELKELFGKYGKVISAKVVMNAKNPSGNCFGCIQLASVNDAKKCITNLDQTEFRGNTISITNDIGDKAAKDKNIRPISPVSSSESWGSKKNSGNKKSPINPTVTSQAVNKVKTDSFDKDKRPPYREKPNSAGGVFYKTREFTDNRGSITRRGANNDRRGMDRFTDKQSNDKPYYKSSNAFGSSSYSSNNDNRDNRNRSDIYMRRDVRDSYNSSSMYESSNKYGSSFNRDRSSTNRQETGGYPDRLKSCYDYRNKPPANTTGSISNTARYENYDDHFDRRDKRSAYDRPPIRDIDNSYRRDVYKRSGRPDDNDDYYTCKKRRADLISSERSPHYYRTNIGGNGRGSSIETSKKSYYPLSTSTAEKDFRKPEFKSRRDEYNSTDYNNSHKNDRDFFSGKRSMEYSSSSRRDGGGYDGGYSPDNRHATRSNNYSKDQTYSQHSTNFGGRSRRY